MRSILSTVSGASFCFSETRLPVIVTSFRSTFLEETFTFNSFAKSVITNSCVAYPMEAMITVIGAV